MMLETRKSGATSSSESRPEDLGEIKAASARLAGRTGDPMAALAAWRDACGAFLATGRPVQAIGAAFEAGWLDPASPSPSAEAVRVARTAFPSVEESEGQRFLAELDLAAREALV